MHNKEILPIEDIALAFSNIETLFETHSKLLSALKEIGETSFVGDIGKVY